MGIRIFDLLLDILGSIQDTMIGDIISMTPPNGLIAAMGGRAIGRYMWSFFSIETINITKG